MASSLEFGITFGVKLVMILSAGHLRVVGGLLSEHKLFTFVDGCAGPQWT